MLFSIGGIQSRKVRQTASPFSIYTNVRDDIVFSVDSCYIAKLRKPVNSCRRLRFGRVDDPSYGIANWRGILYFFHFLRSNVLAIFRSQIGTAIYVIFQQVLNPPMTRG